MRGTPVAVALLIIGLVASSGRGQSPYPPAPPPGWGTAPPVYYPPPHPPQYAQPVQYTPPAAMPPAAVAAPRGPASNFDTSPGSDPDARVWLVGEYLYWRISGARTPPLLTASPAGTPQAQAGVIGAPGTTVLVGGDPVNDDFRSGGRFRAGLWLDQEQKFGVEVGFFFLEGQGDGGSAGSRDGGAIVSRPFVDAITGQNNAELVSFPGVLSGTSVVDAGSSAFYGGNVLLGYNVCCGTLGWGVGKSDSCHFRLDLLGGVSYLRFADSLRVGEDLSPLADPFAAGTRFQIFDDFQARNIFRGAALGFDAEFSQGPWSLIGRVLLNVGQTSRRVTINGETTTSVPGGGSVTSTGGLLALVSNIGTYNSDAFSVIPQGDLWVGYRLHENVRLLAGYSTIYWTRVARAAEQIDPVVNRNLLPPVGAGAAGPSRPTFVFNNNDLWVHGLTAGLELSY